MGEGRDGIGNVRVTLGTGEPRPTGHAMASRVRTLGDPAPASTVWYVRRATCPRRLRGVGNTRDPVPLATPSVAAKRVARAHHG